MVVCRLNLLREHKSRKGRKALRSCCGRCCGNYSRCCDFLWDIHRHQRRHTPIHNFNECLYKCEKTKNNQAKGIFISLSLSPCYVMTMNMTSL